MKKLIVLFLTAISTEIYAVNLGHPVIQLNTQVISPGITVLEATVGPLTDVAGVQFDILLPASIADAIDISSCQTSTENLATDDILLSCNALTFGDTIRVRYIIASLTQQSLSGELTLSNIKIDDQKIPIGSYTALLDPCTSTYADTEADEGHFAISDMKHLQITKSASSEALESQILNLPLSEASPLWSNELTQIESLGAKKGYKIESFAPEWNTIPRYINMKLPDENKERTLAVTDVIRAQDGESRGACEIDAVSSELQSLASNETIHVQASGESIYLGLTFTKSGMQGYVSSPGAAFSINTLDSEYWLLKADAPVQPGNDVYDESAQNNFLSTSGPAFVCPEIPRFETIDIAIFYSAAAANFVTQMGGNIEDDIQTFVAETNTALANSVQIPTRLNPILIQQTDYVENGDNFSLISAFFRIFLNDQGILPQIHADIASFVGVSSTQNFCTGLAPPIFDFNRAISLQNEIVSSVTAQCIYEPTMVFAHEVGHSLGGQHNPNAIGQAPPPPPPPYDDSTAPFPYSFAHWFIDTQINEGFSTILSGRAECSAATGSFCTVVPYYSTPGATFNSQPLGIPDARDNSRSLDCYAPHIALRRTPPEDIYIDGFEGLVL